MDDTEFDRTFITHAFRTIAQDGWRRFSLAAAANAADLPLDRVRARFPGRSALLLRFGLLADQAALAERETDGSVRDRLFALIMRRIDVLQAHREGVIALLRALPGDPPTALMLSCASQRSMAWLLAASGVPVTACVVDQIRVKGLLAVWLWTVNAWRQDESADLASTMAALDVALGRADRAAGWLAGLTPGKAAAAPPTAPSDEPPDISAIPADL